MLLLLFLPYKNIKAKVVSSYDFIIFAVLFGDGRGTEITFFNYTHFNCVLADLYSLLFVEEFHFIKKQTRSEKQITFSGSIFLLARQLVVKCLSLD